MRWKLFVEFCLTVFIFGILAGDLFLPQPYLSKSQQVKSSFNHYLADIVSHKKFIEIHNLFNYGDRAKDVKY